MSQYFHIETNALKTADKLFGRYSVPKRFAIPRHLLEDSSDDGEWGDSEDEEAQHSIESELIDDKSDHDREEEEAHVPLQQAEGKEAEEEASRELESAYERGWHQLTDKISSDLASKWESSVRSGMESTLHFARDDPSVKRRIAAAIDRFTHNTEIGGMPKENSDSFLSELDAIKKSVNDKYKDAVEVANLLTQPESLEQVIKWQSEHHGRRARAALDRIAQQNAEFEAAAKEKADKEQRIKSEKEQELDMIRWKLNKLPSLRELTKVPIVDPKPKNRLSLEEYQNEISEWLDGYEASFRKEFAHDNHQLPYDEQQQLYNNYKNVALQLWHDTALKSVNSYASALATQESIEKAERELKAVPFVNPARENNENANEIEAKSDNEIESESEDESESESESENDSENQIQSLGFKDLASTARNLSNKNKLSSAKQVEIYSRVVKLLKKEANAVKKADPSTETVRIRSVRLNADGTFSRLGAIVSVSRTIRRVEATIDKIQKLKEEKEKEREKKPDKQSSKKQSRSPQKPKIPADKSGTSSTISTPSGSRSGTSRGSAEVVTKSVKATSATKPATRSGSKMKK